MSNFKKYFSNTLKNNYANFKGRARRSEYWYFQLFLTVTLIFLSMAFGLIDGLLGDNVSLRNITTVILGLFILLTIIPNLALAVRRLHDTGKSGWMYFFSLIPIIGTIILLVFLCKDSSPGSNQYGPNPKELGGDNADHLVSDEV